MSIDMKSQVRAYADFLDSTLPVLEAEDAMVELIGDPPVQPVQERPLRSIEPAPKLLTSSPRRRSLQVALAAVTVGVLIAGVAWLTRGTPAGEVIDQPSVTSIPTPTTTPTTTAAVTTLPVEGATIPPEFGSSQAPGNLFEHHQTDFDGALPGDDGAGPLPLGTVNEPPGEDRLDFLFERCSPVEGSVSVLAAVECRRVAHFLDANNAQLGSQDWTVGRPFYVRHGFLNSGDAPLGDGFDVVLYVTFYEELEEVGGPTSGPFTVGQTYEFASDYVLRGTSNRCGPTYRTQTGTETCEWFVHVFPDGLPFGEYEVVAAWEAPCSAWLGLGFTDTCDDPAEVISLFSSGLDGILYPESISTPEYIYLNEVNLSREDVFEERYGVSADQFSRWLHTVDRLIVAANDGRLDDYAALFADGATIYGAPFDLDTEAALMAAGVRFDLGFCRPGDGGDITCGPTSRSDRFHGAGGLEIRADFSFSLDDRDLIISIEVDQTEQAKHTSADGRIGLLDHAEYAAAFADWLTRTYPDVAASFGQTVSNGMPAAADIPTALQYVAEFVGR